jgi:hypothetical protein
VGAYFLKCLYSDIESLRLYAGIWKRRLSGMRPQPFHTQSHEIREDQFLSVKAERVTKRRHICNEALVSFKNHRTTWNKRLGARIGDDNAIGQRNQTAWNEPFRARASALQKITNNCYSSLCVTGVRINVLASDIGAKLLIAMLFPIQNEAYFFPLPFVSVVFCSQEHPQFQRHIEARQP